MIKIDEMEDFIEGCLAHVGLSGINRELVRNMADPNSYTLHLAIRVDHYPMEQVQDARVLVMPLLDGIKDSPYTKELERDRDEAKALYELQQKYVKELEAYIKVSRSIQHNIPLHEVRL